MVFGLESVIGIFLLLAGLSFYFWRKHRNIKKTASKVYFALAIIILLIILAILLMFAALIAMFNGLN